MVHNAINKDKFDWQKELQNSFSDVQTFLNYLQIDTDSPHIASHGQRVMPMRVPISFAQRIRKNDLEDPLLRQVLPSLAEDQYHSDDNFTQDPLSESDYLPQTGVLHKYRGRALLVINGSCAIHCRYCFRREFDYRTNVPSKKAWRKTFDYLENDPSIEEIILSGGDPLLMSDDYLKFFIDHLTALSHIKRIRFHTRIPVVLPSRITPQLLNILNDHHLQSVIVVHVNHPAEIDSDVKTTLNTLRSNHHTLLNQSTLLKGVNDDALTIAQLSETLFDSGVLPYYMHLLDQVRGSQHFFISLQSAIHIYKQVQSLLSGYLVPRFVKEYPGQPHKTHIYQI